MNNSAWHKTALTILAILFIAAKPAYAKSSSEHTGDVLQILIPTSGLLASLVVEDSTEGTGQWGLSLLTTIGITSILKLSVHKTRPNGVCCNAFPSGHTSASFMGASFIHRRYGVGYAIPAYIAATYVAHTRVANDKHDLTDVTAGAMVGLLGSYLFTTRYKGLTLEPLAGNGYYGLSVNQQW